MYKYVHIRTSMHTARHWKTWSGLTDLADESPSVLMALTMPETVTWDMYWVCVGCIMCTHMRVGSHTVLRVWDRYRIYETDVWEALYVHSCANRFTDCLDGLQLSNTWEYVAVPEVITWFVSEEWKIYHADVYERSFKPCGVMRQPAWNTKGRTCMCVSHDSECTCRQDVCLFACVCLCV